MDNVWRDGSLGIRGIWCSLYIARNANNKSDDVVGRVKTYEAIVKGENVPEPGVPEGFKVLIKELQSLGLDIKLYSEDNKELELKENIEDGIDFNFDSGKEDAVDENDLMMDI